VVRGIAIPTPIGKPEEEPETEYEIRKALFKRALDALATDIEEATTFDF
jgi:hypothetical protein